MKAPILSDEEINQILPFDKDNSRMVWDEVELQKLRKISQATVDSCHTYYMNQFKGWLERHLEEDHLGLEYYLKRGDYQAFLKKQESK